MDDDDDAVAAIAAVVCEALADPTVRAEVADLVAGATDARRRRFEELAERLAEELADAEIRVPLIEDPSHGIE
jgi:predicted nuclease with TOPRIM domain